MSDSTSSTPPMRGVGSARVRLVRVLPVAGRRASTVVLADAADAALTIGREGHATGPLALDDTEASRAHASLEPDGDGAWSIVDLGSRNGTFVDGQRITRARLVDGSVIRVGRTLLVFVDAEVRATDGLVAPADTRMAGASLATLRVHDAIGMVAPHPVPVLIQGESGVGKEVVAEEIHRRSGRAGAFIAVNCAAIAPQLAESELFGHVVGAFTGASKASDGLFVAADQGTLFLDEIGELPLELQPKLLRALAQGEVRAVGATTGRTVAVRVVAATLRDLERDVAAGTFRADLFNRLCGWRVELPPLRRRRDDVVTIAAAYLARRAGPALSPDAAEALLVHDWPGNVRELEQVLATAMIRAADTPPGGLLEGAHLPASLVARLGERAVTVLPATHAIPLGLVAPREQAPTRDELAAAFTRYDGNVARVAEHYGKERPQIYRWAKRLGLDPDAFRKP